MTSSEMDATLARQMLRDVAMRATAARVAVLRTLASARGPRSHADVVHALAEFGFDQSTLFRSLHELADAGLVTRLDLGDQTRRFELRQSRGGAEYTHSHFMCVDCGELTCMQDFSVQITPSRRSRIVKLGTVTEIMIRGHCGKCKSM